MISARGAARTHQEHRDIVFLLRDDIHYLRAATRRSVSECSCKVRDIGTQVLEMTQIFDIDRRISSILRFVHIAEQTADGVFRGFLRCREARCGTDTCTDLDVFPRNKSISLSLCKAIRGNDICEAIRAIIPCDIVKGDIKGAGTGMSITGATFEYALCDCTTLHTTND